MTYPAGCTVEHAKYGIGIVTLGGDERVHVLFDDGVERRLTHLAGLRRVAAQIKPRTDADLERELRQGKPRRRAMRYPHHCVRCGGEWLGLKAEPKLCVRCGSKDWRRPKATYSHHCYRCGGNWVGTAEQPGKCRVCGLRHWNEPKYKPHVPMMCRCGATTKSRQARSKPHHYCDPDWRRKNMIALNARRKGAVAA